MTGLLNQPQKATWTGLFGQCQCPRVHSPLVLSLSWSVAAEVVLNKINQSQASGDTADVWILLQHSPRFKLGLKARSCQVLGVTSEINLPNVWRIWVSFNADSSFLGEFRSGVIQAPQLLTNWLQSCFIKTFNPEFYFIFQFVSCNLMQEWVFLGFFLEWLIEGQSGVRIVGQSWWAGKILWDLQRSRAPAWRGIRVILIVLLVATKGFLFFVCPIPQIQPRVTLVLHDAT